jgi:hypothetical protein
MLADRKIIHPGSSLKIETRKWKLERDREIDPTLA